MEVILSKPNPKALNLNGLDSETRKVTVGFKCNPRVKLKLAQEAKKVGITLSELVENYILNIESVSNSDNLEIDDLKSKLSFYENDILLDLYKKHKGEIISFTSYKGQNMKVEVKEPKNIYSILINSFKDNR